MEKPLSTYYETRLQREIEEIDARIKELTQEKLALQRQLMKARRESSGLADVNRKNSVTRIMVENRVMEALQGASKPVSSFDLLREARFVNFELKENTFRTYLHRMKSKGLIEQAGHAGTWRIQGQRRIEKTPAS